MQSKQDASSWKSVGPGDKPLKHSEAQGQQQLQPPPNNQGSRKEQTELVICISDDSDDEQVISKNMLASNAARCLPPLHKRCAARCLLCLLHAARISLPRTPRTGDNLLTRLTFGALLLSRPRQLPRTPRMARRMRSCLSRGRSRLERSSPSLTCSITSKSVAETRV